MKLTINLATRRYLNLRLLNIWLLAGFILLGALLILKVREVAYNQAELATIRRQSAVAESRPGEAPVSPAQLNALAAKALFANALIARKSVNWLNLLDLLEEVVPNGVALSAIQPDKGDLLKLGGVARNFADLRALLENMERSKNFSEVYLLSQSETKVGLTQQGLSFSVTCKVNYR
jgi:type IV pilus assembly protein PilN